MVRAGAGAGADIYKAMPAVHSTTQGSKIRYTARYHVHPVSRSTRCLGSTFNAIFQYSVWEISGRVSGFIFDFWGSGGD